MLSRKTAAAGFAFLVGVTAWMAGRPPTGQCAAPPPRGADGYRISAAKVVARPWYGPHQVYAIFVIPNRFMDPHYSATLAVHGFEFPIIRNLIPEQSYVDSVLAQPGHYLEQVFLPTRTAAWLLLTGRFGDLKTACHWEFVLVDGTGE